MKQNKKIDLIDNILSTAIIELGGAIAIYFAFKNINWILGLGIAMVWIVCADSVIKERLKKKEYSLLVLPVYLWYEWKNKRMNKE